MHHERLFLGVPLEAGPDLWPLRFAAAGETFRAQGVELAILPLPTSNDVLAALLSERAQAAWMDVPNLARALSTRADLLGVFQWYHQETTALFGLDGVAPRELAGLRGKPVAVPSAGAGAVGALQHALTFAGLKLEHVQPIEAGPDLGRLLASGRVVAAAGSSTFSAWLEARGLAARQFPLGGWETLPGPAIVVPRPRSTKARQQVQGLVAAARRALLAVLSAPGSYVLRAGEALVPGVAPRAEAAQVRATLELLRARPADRDAGWIDPERMTGAERLLRRAGWLDDRVSLEGAFTNEFVVAAGRAEGEV